MLERSPREAFPTNGLTGQKTRLRPFLPEDITSAYLEWLNDPEVVRFSNQRFRHHSADSSRTYLAGFTGSDNLFLSIRRCTDDAALGTLAVYISRPHETADVGILVGERSVWGQGYGQDAWDSILAWLLGDGGVRKVTAGTIACNLGMISLMRRSGMQHEATRTRQEIVENRYEDLVYYAKFRSV